MASSLPTPTSIPLPSPEELEREYLRALGQALRGLREARGLQKAEVIAQALRRAPKTVGLIPSAYTHWEAGRRAPSARQIAVLLLTLGASEDESLTVLVLVFQCDSSLLGGHIEQASGKPLVASWFRWAESLPQRPQRALRWR